MGIADGRPRTELRTPARRNEMGTFAATVCTAVTAIVTLSIYPAAPAAAKPMEGTLPIASRVNPTGRVISIPVPVKEGDTTLGEIVIRIDPDDSVHIPTAALVEILRPIVSKDVAASLENIKSGKNALTIADLRALGFNASFNPNLLELTVTTGINQRPTGDISIRRTDRIASFANAARPAVVSGYINVVTGADYVWQSEDNREGFGALRFDADSALRFGDIVLENEFSYESEDPSNACPMVARCFGPHEPGFKRRGSRFVYDIPESLIRVTAGDSHTLATGFQNGPDVAGITIEQSPRKLAPGENIRPTGRSSFSLERPSEVEVVINGAVTQRLRLRAGNYNLTDLPLQTGANDVQLVITDETGQRQTMAFTTFFNGYLLAPGRTEWVATGGVPSYFKDNEQRYRDTEYFLSGYYREGLTESLTGEIHVQASKETEMAGGGVILQNRLGFFNVQAAGSHSDRGNGIAGSVSWEISDVTGLVDKGEHLRAGIEYRSDWFRVPGTVALDTRTFASPQASYYLRLNASYSLPVGYNMTGTLAGRYDFVDPALYNLTTYTIIGDRYGVDLTLSRPVFTDASASFTVGYSNESYGKQAGVFNRDESDFRVGVRVYWRPDEKTRVSSNYDSINDRSYVSATRTEGRGLDRWEASADVQHDTPTTKVTAGGSLTYFGNRSEVRVSHASGFRGLTYDTVRLLPADERTSVRVGTSLAFADGQVAIGAPIRGGGFAIVSPHDSLAGREVTVGTRDEVKAVADALGPAVVSNLPAYVATPIPYDVADLPVGYNLGTGQFDVVAPYRGGYALTVGSQYSVSAYGTLLHADGTPVDLLTGEAVQTDNPTKRVALFTNADGRFGAEGLAPGRWTIEVAGEETTEHFVIEIPHGVDGLFQAGTLSPAGAR